MDPMDKAEYPVTFNFGEFNKKVSAEVKSAIQKTEEEQKHNIPIKIDVGKVKLIADRQGNLIGVEGDLAYVKVTGTITKRKRKIRE